VLICTTTSEGLKSGGERGPTQAGGRIIRVGTQGWRKVARFDTFKRS
jgi:hypothetical protein